MTAKLSRPLIYFSIISFFCSAAFVSFLTWGLTSADHFAAIPLDGKTAFYRNYGDRLTREIQDRDILYHNIGKSIQHARQADIVLIGHSMLLWGMRADLIEQFERKHGVKIYNLGSAGDGSGEFLRLVIKRWKLKPKLWVINADDHAANFFNVSLDDFGVSGKSSAINVVKYGRLKGWVNVVGRNVRWRVEDFLFDHLPRSLTKSFFSGSGLQVWRNAENGNWYLEKVSSYVDPNNALIKLTRPQNCHTNPMEIARAKRYLSEIGGTSIFTLVPYHEFCPQRVRELASSLNVETVVPPNVAYSSADGGAHLDKKGAIAFTSFFLAALEKTKAFKKIAPY